MDLASTTVVVVRAFLVVTMLGVGLQLGLRGASRTALSRGWIVGMLAVNLLLVPAVGVLVCLAFGFRGEVAVGVLACAVAPAGSLAPKLVQLARGDLARGVIATFGLSLLATLSVPPTLAIGSGILGIDATTAAIDVAAVMASLAIFQLTPMLLGLAIARRSPAIGRRAIRPLVLGSNALIGSIVVVAVLDTADDLVSVGPWPLIAIVIVALVGHATGRGVGGAAPPLRRASGLVSAQRSPGLALLVVAGPGHPIATATVVVATLGLTVLNVTAALLYGRLAAHRAASPAIDPSSALEITRTG